MKGGYDPARRCLFFGDGEQEASVCLDDIPGVAWEILGLVLGYLLLRTLMGGEAEG